MKMNRIITPEEFTLYYLENRKVESLISYIIHQILQNDPEYKDIDIDYNLGKWFLVTKGAIESIKVEVIQMFGTTKEVSMKFPLTYLYLDDEERKVVITELGKQKQEVFKEQEAKKRKREEDERYYIFRKSMKRYELEKENRERVNNR